MEKLFLSLIILTTLLKIIFYILLERREYRFTDKFYKQFPKSPFFNYSLTKMSSPSVETGSDTAAITILYWTQYFQEPKDLSSSLIACQNFKCVCTNDRNYLDVSSAVLFHARDFYFIDRPKIKRRGQKFVFASHESPQLTFVPLQQIPMEFFDWTMTYRSDSDVYCPYGYFDKLDQPKSMFYSLSGINLYQERERELAKSAKGLSGSASIQCVWFCYSVFVCVIDSRRVCACVSVGDVT